jgi:hypothetical protein
LPQDDSIADITTLFRRVFEHHGALDPDLKGLLESGLPLGTLTDLVAHSLGLPPAIKQELLAETRVDRRAETLLEILQQIAARDYTAMLDLRTFPPPFSAN